MSETRVKMTCACHVRRCDICTKCSRCGCGHDGVSVETKMSRKKGGKQPTGSNKNGKRSNATKTTLSYAESDGSDEDSYRICSTPVLTTKKNQDIMEMKPPHQLQGRLSN